MTFACTFWVNGDPAAQPRPRARRQGAQARVYSPKRAKNSKGETVTVPVYPWRAAIVEAARPHRPATPLDCPLQVDLVFYFARPQRLMRPRSPDRRLPHTTKPDRDNLDKAVLDCLKVDGWWVDDSRVCAGSIHKFYVAKGEEPGLEVTVRELEVATC